MSAASELLRFHEFVGMQLQAGGDFLSPEQCLELWRRRSSAESAESLAEVRMALQEMDGGDAGVPAREFLRSLRPGGQATASS